MGRLFWYLVLFFRFRRTRKEGSNRAQDQKGPAATPFAESMAESGKSLPALSRFPMLEGLK